MRICALVTVERRSHLPRACHEGLPSRTAQTPSPAALSSPLVHPRQGIERGLPRHPISCPRQPIQERRLRIDSILRHGPFVPLLLPPGSFCPSPALYSTRPVQRNRSPVGGRHPSKRLRESSLPGPRLPGLAPPLVHGGESSRGILGPQRHYIAGNSCEAGLRAVTQQRQLPGSGGESVCMLRVIEIGSEGSGTGPILLVLQELLCRRVPQEEPVRPANEAPRPGAPSRVPGLSIGEPAPWIDTTGAVGSGWNQSTCRASSSNGEA